MKKKQCRIYEPKILKRRHFEQIETYQMEYLDEEGGAIIAILPCNQNGEINNDEHSRLVERIADAVSAGIITHQEIRKHVYSWWNPARIRCFCGNRFYLNFSINTCGRCGKNFSAKGEQLKEAGRWQ